jgi:thioredoxin-disulfide reductase
MNGLIKPHSELNTSCDDAEAPFEKTIVAKKLYDVLIIGAGPAGLTAAIYARRRLLRTLIVTMDIGGQVVLTDNIENYLGYTEKSGPGLAIIFEKQVREYGAEIILAKVKRVVKQGDVFQILTTTGDYVSKAVIITGGRMPRRLSVPGEEDFLGKGINNSLTCDLSSCNEKRLAIVGGGNTALQRAEVFSMVASKIYIIHRRENFRSDEVTLEKVRKKDNVEFFLNAQVNEFNGSDRLESITVSNIKTGDVKKLEIDTVFLDIGRDINLDYAEGLVKTDVTGKIITDKGGRTSCKGVFAAGDITDSPYAQAIIAAGQGAAAALSAYAYLIKGKAPQILY